MTTKTECTIYLAINEDGEYEVHTEEADAVELLNENWGGGMRRIVRLTVRVAPPAMAEAHMDVPDTAGETIEATVE